MELHENNLQYADGNEGDNPKKSSHEEVDREKNLDENSRNAEELNTSKEEYNEVPNKDYRSLSPESLVGELEHLLAHFPVNRINNAIRTISKEFNKKIKEEEKKIKDSFLADGGDEKEFYFNHPEKSNFQKAFNEFKKQRNAYYKNQEENEKQNLEKRNQLIEDLKKLYTEFDGNNHDLFKEFRRIKSDWHDAGRVPSVEANNVFRNYYHHLDNFYEYLSLNKELQSLDHEHNLEVRKSIIQKAESLLQEDNIKKALNELQYLHKLWKEEAVPVAEEHREPTWNTFKDITQKIHDKKNDYFNGLKERESENEIAKNKIIETLKNINKNEERSHNFFQKTLKQVEGLRKEFIAIGKAPKSVNQKMWDEFKKEIRTFNRAKNKFYKEMKHEQSDNLKKKKDLLQKAKENVDREDWDEAVNFFKNIQEEWKKTGMVPRKHSNEIWKEFNETCNQFFNRLKSRNQPNREELIKNLENKKKYLEELYPLDVSKMSEEDLEKELQEISKNWSDLGNVPSNEKNIESKFLDVINQKIKESGHEINFNDIKSKIRLNNLKNSGDENKRNDLLRKLRSQMDEVKKELIQLENNLSFFANTKKDNPLLKGVHKDIAHKTGLLNKIEQEYQNLRNIDFTKEEAQELDNPAEE